MQKSILSMAVLAIFSTASYAQSSVTFYGSVDAGVGYTSNGAVKGSNTLSVNSGVLAGSKFGFLGVEDLGGGLKAKFQLEAGFDSDTGALKTYPGNYAAATPTATGGAPINGLFNRRSYVGLDGAYGSVYVGRDYTPSYYALLNSDVQRMTLYGNLQETVFLTGTAGERFGRASNAVFYTSPTLRGFLVHAMYSFGSESAGGTGNPPADANRMWGLSGHYTVGGLAASLSYQQLRLPMVAGIPLSFTGSTGTRDDMVIGARYTFGDYSLGTGYFMVKQPTPNNDASDVWLGGTMKLGTGTISMQLQRMRQQAAIGEAKKANIFSVSYVYPFSKSTALFASYGQVNNSSASAITLIAGDSTVAPGVTGADIRALALGIRHHF